jgi:hypothetical protein
MASDFGYRILEFAIEFQARMFKIFKGIHRTVDHG